MKKQKLPKYLAKQPTRLVHSAVVTISSQYKLKPVSTSSCSFIPCHYVHVRNKPTNLIKEEIVFIVDLYGFHTYPLASFPGHTHLQSLITCMQYANREGDRTGDLVMCGDVR